MPRNSHLGSAAKPNQFPLMRRILFELIVAVALTLAAILASVGGASAAEIMVTEAFARASATPGAKAGAAYVSLMNHGAEADRLVAVSTPVAGMASLHQSVEENGVMKMPELGATDIAPMGTLEMKPGGIHVMLMDLKTPLKKGDTITITFTFEKAGKVEVVVPVGSVAEMGHDHGAGESSGG